MMNNDVIGGVSINTLLERLRKFIEIKLSKFDRQDAVAFLGLKGAGKSILIDYLNGCKIDINDENGYLDAIEPLFSEDFAIVGHDGAETLDPQNCNGFIDTPGFLDDRNETTRVGNVLTTHLALSKARLKGIVITIDANSLFTTRSELFEKLLFALNAYFKNPSELKQSVLFVITQSERREKKHILNKLQQSKAIKVRSDIKSPILDLIDESNVIISNLLDNGETREAINRWINSRWKYISPKNVNVIGGNSDSVQLKLTEVITKISLDGNKVLDDIHIAKEELSKLKVQHDKLESSIAELNNQESIVGERKNLTTNINSESTLKEIIRDLQIQRGKILEKIKHMEHDIKAIIKGGDRLLTDQNGLKPKISISESLEYLNCDEPAVALHTVIRDKRWLILGIFTYTDRTIDYNHWPIMHVTLNDDENRVTDNDRKIAEKCNQKLISDNSGRFLKPEICDSVNGKYKIRFQTNFGQDANAEVVIYTSRKYKYHQKIKAYQDEIKDLESQIAVLTISLSQNKEKIKRYKDLLANSKISFKEKNDALKKSLLDEITQNIKDCESARKKLESTEYIFSLKRDEFEMLVYLAENFNSLDQCSELKLFLDRYAVYRDKPIQYQRVEEITDEDLMILNCFPECVGLRFLPIDNRFCGIFSVLYKSNIDKVEVLRGNITKFITENSDFYQGKTKRSIVDIISDLSKGLDLIELDEVMIISDAVEKVYPKRSIVVFDRDGIIYNTKVKVTEEEPIFLFAMNKNVYGSAIITNSHTKNEVIDVLSVNRFIKDLEDIRKSKEDVTRDLKDKAYGMFLSILEMISTKYGLEYMKEKLGEYERNKHFLTQSLQNVVVGTIQTFVATRTGFFGSNSASEEPQTRTWTNILSDIEDKLAQFQPQNALVL